MSPPRAGIDFIPENGGGVGVRMRRARSQTTSDTAADVDDNHSL